MRYQLEIELPGRSKDDFDLLTKLDSTLIQTLNDQHVVDANDIGSGTMTEFILTNDPEQAFQVSKTILQQMNLLSFAKIRYREYPASDENIRLWPDPDNIARIVACLQRLYREGGDKNALVIDGDIEAGYYIQFAGGVGQDRLYAEAVGNVFLKQEFKLNKDQVRRVGSLGWKAPSPDGGNFHRYWRAATDMERKEIAQLVMLTLTEVYRVGPHHPLEIDLILQ